MNYTLHSFFFPFKVAFDQMISLIPSLQEDRHGRTSKALVLQKGKHVTNHFYLGRKVVNLPPDKNIPEGKPSSKNKKIGMDWVCP